MDIKKFRDILFQRAKEEGFTDYEIYFVNGDSFRVSIYEGEIDQYSVNTDIGLSFRGLFDGKMGYSYTEILDDEALEMLIKSAKENALAIEDEDVEIIYGEKNTYSNVDSYNEELEKVDASKKIDLAMKLEKEAKEQSDKVKSIDDCVVASGKGERYISNSKGLDLSHISNMVYALVSAVVEEDGKVNTAYSFKATYDFNEIDTKRLAEEAVTKALSYMGAQSVPTGKYGVIVKNDVMADILETFSGIFSAYSVQKELSLLKGKLKTKIASDIVTLIDDPLMEKGLASIPFDDEGVATYTKAVIGEGILNTYLYNLKTAKKDGVESTGNASKASYASPIGTSPSNFYIKPGNNDIDELKKLLGKGLLITEVQGLHSGANTVSGDFSLGAKGFLIKNGLIERPVEQITIAGNFYKILLDIVDLGSDLKFGIPSGSSCFGSPSVIVKEMSVAGK
ncbi:MAG: TldD/PmbA family protein [Clostridiales bacterium]|nr:TldD/PmbA family protein [Clostridiales bacterium]